MLAKDNGRNYGAPAQSDARRAYDLAYRIRGDHSVLKRIPAVSAPSGGQQQR